MVGSTKTKPAAKELEETRKPITPAEALKGRELVLAVLERAAEESDFLARLADNPRNALAEYYTLTSEEYVALATGDINRIEEWARYRVSLHCRRVRGALESPRPRSLCQ